MLEICLKRPTKMSGLMSNGASLLVEVEMYGIPYSSLPYSGLYWRGFKLGDLAIPFLIAKFTT
jgi:hypothetical protein